MQQPNKYTYKIAARELDFARRPTLAAIIDHVLTAAGDDADRNGFGVRNLEGNNWSWVLSRFCMDIIEYPAAYSELEVTTWVSEIGRLMTTRNFTVTDGNGKPLLSAISNWAMIDMTTRKAVDLSAKPEYADYICTLPSPTAMPARLGALTCPSATTHRVAYSDLDFNRHTNTIRYIELMADLLPLESHESLTPSRIDMNFLHESRYGDTLSVAAEIADEACFEIRNQDAVSICRTRIQFTPRKA